MKAEEKDMSRAQMMRETEAFAAIYPPYISRFPPAARPFFEEKFKSFCLAIQGCTHAQEIEKLRNLCAMCKDAIEEIKRAAA